jgi:uncharacterized protein (DUF433 family)
MSEYITKLEKGAYRIAGTRVSLDSIVYSFWNGETPETIVQNFSTLQLEQVYGAIAFYLANRNEIDEYMRQGEVEFEKLNRQWRKKNVRLYEKLEKARQTTGISMK